MVARNDKMVARNDKIMKGEIILYQPDNSISLEVRLEDDTVWLTQAQMVVLFQTTKQNVSLHISNIFKEGELERELVVKESLTTTIHGAVEGKTQQKRVSLYNLDVIISVGYRIKSLAGTRFRQWASSILKQYMLKGYAVHPTLQQVEYHLTRQIIGQREELYHLQQQVQQHQQQIDFLIQREQPVTEQLFSTGCVWDAYTFVSDLVRSAASRLILIDPFVDERTLLLLDKRAEGVECTVHTRYGEQIELDFQKHNQQCVPISKVQLSRAVHDRYLIVDDEVWLLGASVKDMGRSLCTIIKLGFSPDEILNRL